MLNGTTSTRIFCRPKYRQIFCAMDRCYIRARKNNIAPNNIAATFTLRAGGNGAGRPTVETNTMTLENVNIPCSVALYSKNW